MNFVEMAAALFIALEAGDTEVVRNLCQIDLKASQNGGPTFGLDSLLNLSLAATSVVKDFHYENAVRSATESGFVEEHQVCGTLPDGGELNLAVCVVAQLRDGKISVLREYFDSRAAAKLVVALGTD